MATPLTKVDIKKCIKAWNDHGSVKEAIEASGVEEGRFRRIISLVREARPTLVPKKFRTAYIKALIAETLAEL